MDKKTFEYYRENADSFIARTENTKFNTMQNKFTDYLTPGASILDFGCGSGRDAKAFQDQGFQVSAIDGTAAFAERAKELGISSRCMQYSQFEDEDLYDGIWACASLLHLEDDELKDTLCRIHRALKPDGILYCSMKKGNFQGERDGRWFHDQTPESLQQVLEMAGFQILELFGSEDSRPEQKGRPWVNAIAKKNH